MSGPQFSRRDAQPLDMMLKQAGGSGWPGLEELFKPHLANAELQPSDVVAKNLAMLVRHQNGREMIEWIMDVTLRAPWRVQAGSIEETALRAAQRQGINGVAEAILAAIAHGETLLNQTAQEKS